ncbi:MAG: hypothetical protein IT489_08190 [Gammaproteobacteria bacterium]|nr:hypothetical protein [Gammaproteobacteria bacterium]
MNPPKMKQDGDKTRNAGHSEAATQDSSDRIRSKPVRYIVPGLYLTPFGDRRDGCLKARC